jgi:hypothetical protein
MFKSQPSFSMKIEMTSIVIIGYGWHHISVINLHEVVTITLSIKGNMFIIPHDKMNRTRNTT